MDTIEGFYGVTIEEIGKALSMQYDVKLSVKKGISFERGKYHIWYSRKGWITAIEYGHKYDHHKRYPHDDIMGALNRCYELFDEGIET